MNSGFVPSSASGASTSMLPNFSLRTLTFAELEACDMRRWCPDCRSYEAEGHTHALGSVFEDHRSYPLTVRVNPPRSFGEGFGATLGVAAGLLVAAWIFRKLGD
jgi:hypothetical protein